MTTDLFRHKIVQGIVSYPATACTNNIKIRAEETQNFTPEEAIFATYERVCCVQFLGQSDLQIERYLRLTSLPEWHIGILAEEQKCVLSHINAS